MRLNKRNKVDNSLQRQLIEKHLAALLEQTSSIVTVDAIKYVVLNIGHTHFRDYLDGMLEIFESPDSSVDIDAAIPVIQDAWNYFPHKSMKGRCPAELFELKSAVRPPPATG